jgi:hypothetical protein
LLSFYFLLEFKYTVVMSSWIYHRLNLKLIFLSFTTHLSLSIYIKHLCKERIHYNWNHSQTGPRQHVPLIEKHSCFQRSPNCIFFLFIKCPIYQRQTTLIDSGEDYARQNKNMSNTLLCAVIYSVHTCF